MIRLFLPASAHLLFVLSAYSLLILSISPLARAASPVQVQYGRTSLSVTTPGLALECSLTTGRWQARWPGAGASRPAIRGADCTVKLDDGTQLTASDYSHHTCLAADVTSIKGTLGSGTQIVIHHRRAGKPELRQIFYIYPRASYFFVRLEAVGSQPLSTHDISPLVIDGAKTPGSSLELGSGEKPRTLFVPYDNDSFIRYSSEYAASSFETTAIYDNTTRRGFIIGSVTHDLWKTGIAMSGAGPHSLAELRVFGGVTGKDTRDTQPHGSVTGTVVASPLVMVGYFSDWREGMETYGRMNARLSPPLAWKSTVPIGWNSWAAYMTSVSSENYTAASDFLKTTLQPLAIPAWKTPYVNLDSFWDNFSVEKKIEDVKQIHAKGQKAGIYWTPFVYWGSDLSKKVEGTDGRYTYAEAVLKDASGKPLPTLDGGLPLDPTHPATLERIDWQCQQFVSWGFDFVKLDFMTHGALEGAHFDLKVMTGTAAYNRGMARITAALSPAKIGRPFFISLSIAPLFPAGYAHSRRISCDTFGTIGNSEYMLNSLTYGWWQGGAVYAFNDGDHAVLYQAHGQSVTTPAEGRSRLNASVVAGSLILDSDDTLDPKARERIIPLLSSRAVLALAQEGKPFRPVEGDTGSDASDVFVRRGRLPDEYYVGVFNYSATAAAAKHFSLARLGLRPDARYQMHDLWTGQTRQVQGSLTISLEAGGSTLLRLTKD